MLKRSTAEIGFQPEVPDLAPTCFSAEARSAIFSPFLSLPRDESIEACYRISLVLRERWYLSQMPLEMLIERASLGANNGSPETLNHIVFNALRDIEEAEHASLLEIPEERVLQYRAEFSAILANRANSILIGRKFVESESMKRVRERLAQYSTPRRNRSVAPQATTDQKRQARPKANSPQIARTG